MPFIQTYKLTPIKHKKHQKHTRTKTILFQQNQKLQNIKF